MAKKVYGDKNDIINTLQSILFDVEDLILALDIPKEEVFKVMEDDEEEDEEDDDEEDEEEDEA